MNSKLLSVITLGMIAVSSVLSAPQAFAAAPKAAKMATASGKAVTLNIASNGEQMMYNKKELSVPANSKVTVIFQNKSAALKHNWVLVKAGKGDKVAAAGIAAGESKGYVVASSDVIAYTKLSAAGKKVQVTFQAPKKGTYDFLCTSPGHNAIMKGKFVVK